MGKEPGGAGGLDWKIEIGKWKIGRRRGRGLTQRAQREELRGHGEEPGKKTPHPENRPFGFAQGWQGAAPATEEAGLKDQRYI
jgi:hypothetical protein